MKVEKVLGDFAWTMLTTMLILVSVMTADGDELFNRIESSSVSAVMQWRSSIF